ncbi:MAG: ABC transporter substrate-binding protein [Thermoanaerobaculia bacterium]
MSKLGRVVVGAFVVAVALGLTHAWLNMGFNPFQKKTAQEEKFKVGFLPVTCHLTCPVSDWIRKNTEGQGLFEPVRFSGWPELKEAHISGQTPATFMLAPMAMALRQQGVPVKIVYLGHRDGSALMVRKESDIHDFEDLRGKRVAVPNRFSNQFLLIFKALKDRGMTIDDINLVEMPPPDMPAALYAKAVDAIISGEPFMGQTELDGYGRVLYQAKELWPNFISCVMVVNEGFLKEHPDKVQALVSGIAKSGLWLEGGMDHRMKAAVAVATQYYNQNPRLLRFVLSKPPDRVTYGNLRLAKGEFEHIAQLALEAGILKKPIAFEEYADTRFSEQTTGETPYAWKGL